MKTIEAVKKTKWNIERRFFVTKKFQGIVLSIDFDVPQAFEYKTICVFKFKLVLIGMWISLEKKQL